MALLGNGRYANITATLALVISLGGVGYAAVQVPKNSVGSKQIKNGAIKAKDLKAGVIPVVPAPEARAYAQLNPDGTVTHSKGITAANVVLGGDSLYCLGGLGFTPKTISATPAFGLEETLPLVAVQFGPNTNVNCSETTQVLVITHTSAGSDTRFPVMIQID